MDKNKENYFDAKGIMDYVESFKKVVERGFVKKYPKFLCKDPVSGKVIDTVDLNNNYPTESKEDFKIVHYITSHNEIFKENLDTLIKRQAFQSGIKINLINKIFSNFTVVVVGFVLAAYLANVGGESRELLSYFMGLPFFVFLLLCLFFVLLDVIYSQGAKYSYTYLNVARSSFYANLKGEYLNNPDYKQSHPVKMIKYFFWELLKGYLIPLMAFTDFIVLRLPMSLLRYIVMILHYPNKIY